MVTGAEKFVDYQNEQLSPKKRFQFTGVNSLLSALTPSNTNEAEKYSARTENKKAEERDAQHDKYCE